MSNNGDMNHLNGKEQGEADSRKSAQSRKAGFAAIVGRPNVGKSTLMNTLVGQKIAITSYKPQTTRNQIRTIYSDENGQVVFLDTPGINQARDRLGAYMLKAAEATLKEVDVILWLVEPRVPLKEEDRAVLRKVAAAGAPVILVITKIDTVKKPEILPVIAAYSEEWKKETGNEPDEIIPVSSRQRTGLDDLRAAIWSHLPEGHPFYDAEMVTTQTEREIAAEMIREKALRYINEEVPHGIAVEIRSMHYRRAKADSLPADRGAHGRSVQENHSSRTSGSGKRRNADRESTSARENTGIDLSRICDIDADIICERESHKGIIIGAGGQMLRRIGTAARIDIENLIGCRVNLKLWVKVRKDWKDDAGALRALGYNEKELQ